MPCHDLSKWFEQVRQQGLESCEGLEACEPNTVRSILDFPESGESLDSRGAMTATDLRILANSIDSINKGSLKIITGVIAFETENEELILFPVGYDDENETHFVTTQT